MTGQRPGLTETFAAHWTPEWFFLDMYVPVKIIYINVSILLKNNRCRQFGSVLSKGEEKNRRKYKNRFRGVNIFISVLSYSDIWSFFE